MEVHTVRTNEHYEIGQLGVLFVTHGFVLVRGIMTQAKGDFLKLADYKQAFHSHGSATSLPL